MQQPPTRKESSFHGDRVPYANLTITAGVDRGQLTPEDEQLIRSFTDELAAMKSVGTWRQNKVTSHLVRWRQWIGPFTENTMPDLMRGISQLKTAQTNRGESYKTNTIIDYIKILKQFYTWLIENEYSDIPEKKLLKLKSPPKPRMTKTAEDILTPDEIRTFLEVAGRDRAMFSLLYESGLRISELGTLTWGQLQFDSMGVVLNTDGKTGKSRYIRLVMCVGDLATWRRDYPFKQSPDALVFLNRHNKPLTHGTITKRIREIQLAAGITKHISPHLFRHSRITHLIRDGVSLPIVGMMMWGDATSKELHCYLHLANCDVDTALLDHYGIRPQDRPQRDRVEPRQCSGCHTISGPTAEYCPTCGLPLSEEAAAAIEDDRRRLADDPQIRQEETRRMILEMRARGEI